MKQCDPLVLRKQTAVTGMVEVCRSFSFKLNVGNFESRDFFCSQRAECRAEDAEEISERVHAFCKAQVMKAVREYLADTPESAAERRIQEERGKRRAS